jgi:hypothetical protein
MLKPVTFSVSLAVALGACSLGLAGGHDKSLPSAQGVAPCAQGTLASAQSGGCGDIGGCGGCGPVAKNGCFGDLFKHKAPQYEYCWVLRKKRVWTFTTPALSFGHGHRGGAGCDTCGGAITPSGQWASPQAGPSGQATYGTGQASYGTGQYGATSGQISAPAGDAVAPPPTANPSTASNGSLLFLAPAGN